jgi:succinoglycan biosynthesis protein ExoH
MWKLAGTENTASMTFVPPGQTSAGITVIRPLLILFMMLAHLFALDSDSLLLGESPLGFANWLTVFLKSAMAKSGVPLLSLISGYLAVQSLRSHGYFGILRRKAIRLVWPLIWANLLCIVLVTYPGQAADPDFRADLSIYPFDAYGWFQATFAFYKLPANQPLFFLKDLFTCFLLLPLLLALARIKYLNFAVMLWMAWKCIFLDSVFLIPVYPLWFMRFDIVFAFYTGIVLFLHANDLLIESRPLNIALIALFLCVAAVASAVYVMYPKAEYLTLFLWLDFTVKLVSVIGCIALMSLLQSGGGGIAAALSWLSPYAYSMFLTHAVSFHLFHKAWLTWFGRPEFFGLSGVLYLLMIFVVATAAAVGLRAAWQSLLNRASSSA